MYNLAGRVDDINNNEKPDINNGRISDEEKAKIEREFQKEKEAIEFQRSNRYMDFDAKEINEYVSDSDNE